MRSSARRTVAETRKMNRRMPQKKTGSRRSLGRKEERKAGGGRGRKCCEGGRRCERKHNVNEERRVRGKSESAAGDAEEEVERGRGRRGGL